MILPNNCIIRTMWNQVTRTYEHIIAIRMGKNQIKIIYTLHQNKLTLDKTNYPLPLIPGHSKLTLDKTNYPLPLIPGHSKLTFDKTNYPLPLIPGHSKLTFDKTNHPLPLIPGHSKLTFDKTNHPLPLIPGHRLHCSFIRIIYGTCSIVLIYLWLIIYFRLKSNFKSWTASNNALWIS